MYSVVCGGGELKWMCDLGVRRGPIVRGVLNGGAKGGSRMGRHSRVGVLSIPLRGTMLVVEKTKVGGEQQTSGQIGCCSTSGLGRCYFITSKLQNKQVFTELRR